MPQLPLSKANDFSANQAVSAAAVTMTEVDHSSCGTEDSRRRVIALRNNRRSQVFRACLLALLLTCFGAGRPATAQAVEEQVDAALQEKHDQGVLWYGEGIEAFQNEDYDQAAEWFTKGIGLEDGDPGWYANRANSYSMLERFGEAGQDYDRAIAAAMFYVEADDPSLAILYYNRGYARNRSGQFLAAVSDFDHVIELDADYPDVHNSLGFLLATAADEEVRDGERALEMLDIALARTEEKSEDRVNVLDSLACAYAEQGRFDEALTTLARPLRWRMKSGWRRTMSRRSANAKPCFKRASPIVPTV